MFGEILWTWSASRELPDEPIQIPRPLPGPTPLLPQSPSLLLLQIVTPKKDSMHARLQILICFSSERLKVQCYLLHSLPPIEHSPPFRHPRPFILLHPSPSSNVPCLLSLSEKITPVARSILSRSTGGFDCAVCCVPLPERPGHAVCDAMHYQDQCPVIY
jgi:hypothetical protein